MHVRLRSQLKMGDSRLPAGQDADFECNKLIDEEKESLRQEVLFESEKDTDVLLNAKSAELTAEAVGDLQNEVKIDEDAGVEGSCEAQLNSADVLEDPDDGDVTEADDNRAFRSVHSYSCPVEKCCSSCESLDQLLEHMKTHSNKEYSHCDVCKKEFFTIDEATEHMQIRKRKECCGCGNTMQSTHSLLDHHRLHTAEKPFRCETCEVRFSFRSDLLTHMGLHTVGKCCLCDHECKSSLEMRIHVRLHMKKDTDDRSSGISKKSLPLKRQPKKHEKTGEKPFKCEHCDYRSKFASSMEVHNRIHTGEKPYSCDECGKRFSRKDGLKVHEMTHTGERPFECCYCEERFNKRYHLTTHFRRHTGETPYSCEQCDKKFSRNDHLKKHVKRKHGS